MTPPMAPLIFLGQRIGKVSFAEMIKPAMLFVALGYLPVVFLVTYIPILSEWLPVALLGQKVLLPAS
jgi:TRAP-type C4-dicarboxylate transport system permease large subunit